MKGLLFLILFVFQISYAKSLSCFDWLKPKTDAVEISSREVKSSPHFSAGSAEVNGLIDVAIAVRKEIGQEKFDYKNQPLESFVPVVRNMIGFLDKAENSLNPISKFANKKAFSDFRAEALSRIESKQVTYQWLILFSFRISVLTESAYFKVFKVPRSAKLNFWKTHEDTLAYVERTQFIKIMLKINDPSRTLILPFMGELGIYEMNRLVANGIAPLGLIFRKIVVDGEVYSPFLFWEHDLGHVSTMDSKHPNFKAFAQAFLQISSQLPELKRRQVEFFFFFFTHERMILTDERRSDVETAVSKMIMHLRSDREKTFIANIIQNPKYFGQAIIDCRVDIRDDQAVDRWIEESLAEFMTVYFAAEKAITN